VPEHGIRLFGFSSEIHFEKPGIMFPDITYKMSSVSIEQTILHVA
jgi:hypothetical protein